MPELWHCQRCGGPVSSEAARRVYGRWVCPPCAAPARTEPAAVFSPLARGRRGWAGAEQESRSLLLRERRRKRLIILMGAILVIAVVCAALGVPALLFRRTAVRESSARCTCKSNLRQIGLACHLYAEDAEDGEEHFPARLDQLCPVYVDNPKVLSCPSAPSSYGDFVKGTVTEKSSSYVLVSGLKATMPGSTILAYDKSAENHGGDGRNVVFADAHVEWMREKKFQETLKKQRAARAAESGVSE